MEVETMDERDAKLFLIKGIFEAWGRVQQERYDAIMSDIEISDDSKDFVRGLRNSRDAHVDSRNSWRDEARRLSDALETVVEMLNDGGDSTTIIEFVRVTLNKDTE
jgi:hypothetical protein